MSRPAQITLVRHAQSLRNKVKKGSTFFADEYARKDIKGIPDYKIPITEEGEAQSLATGEYLREKFGGFDYVYHSGYKRTKDTLEGILQAYSEQERIQMVVRENLFIRERDPGYAYDMTTAESEEAFPWLSEYWQTYGGFFAVPPGGESIAKMVERVYQFLGILFADHQGERILVVTHGGTLRAFRYLLEHWDYERALAWPKGEEPKNCGVTVYDYHAQKKRLLLSEYNTIAY